MTKYIVRYQDEKGFDTIEDAREFRDSLPITTDVVLIVTAPSEDPFGEHFSINSSSADYDQPI